MNELEKTITQVIEENYIPFEWNDKVKKELQDISLDSQLVDKINKFCNYILMDISNPLIPL